MLFGKNNEKGLVLDKGQLKVVEIGKNGIAIEDILIHDAHSTNIGIQMMLVQLAPPVFPIALGIIRMASRPTYDDMVEIQISKAKEGSTISCVDDLLNSGTVFEIN
jgi:2-oxoglutarate ferredoxin oxidoreductase subunit beta